MTFTRLTSTRTHPILQPFNSSQLIHRHESAHKKNVFNLGLPLSHRQLNFISSSTQRLFNTMNLRWLHAVHATYSFELIKKQKQNEKIHSISVHIQHTYMLHVVHQSESGKGYTRESSILICFHMHKVEVSNSHFKFHVFWSRLLFFSVELCSTTQPHPLLILSLTSFSFVSMLLCGWFEWLMLVLYIYAEYEREYKHSVRG